MEKTYTKKEDSVPPASVVNPPFFKGGQSTNTPQLFFQASNVIQRQQSGTTTMKGTWPPSDPTPFYPLQILAILSGTNLEPVLVNSYKEHDKNDQYLANGFYGTDPNDTSTWPQTLWEAIDNIGMKLFMKSIFKVSSRLQSYPSLWAFVKRIQHCWDTSSFGYAFDTLGNDSALRKELEDSPHFCRDAIFSEAIWHGGQDCWREITGQGEGLHICLGKGKAPNVHIDPNQAADGKNIFGYCTYNFSSLWEHAKDVF